MLWDAVFLVGSGEDQVFMRDLMVGMDFDLFLLFCLLLVLVGSEVGWESKL